MPKAMSDFELVARNSTFEPNSGCWLWTASIDKHGYGKSSGMLAHRRSWRAFTGQDPGKWHVLHKCDVRCCVNPDHLFIGTNQDNIDDRIAKGRRSNWPGEGNNRAKLTDDAVREVRKKEKTAREYAVIYGVSPSTIAMVWTRANWDHVE